MPSDLIYREDAKDYARHAMAKGLNVLEYLDEVPAAQARPVKRGKWVYDCERTMHDGWTYKQYHCSLCEFQMIGGIHNFCPNCGCAMDGTE